MWSQEGKYNVVTDIFKDNFNLSHLWAGDKLEECNRGNGRKMSPEYVPQLEPEPVICSD